MQVSLTKHHGLGNDFLVYNRAQGEIAGEWPQRALEWCHRENGIGADGLLLLGIENDTTLSMRLYNADGSVAEMSGNGIRCLVQAAHSTLGNNAGTTYEVITDAGVREVTVVSHHSDGQILARVDMGEVSDLDAPKNWNELQCDPLRPVRHVSLGNPHSVVGVDDVVSVDLESLGALVPHINLEIIQPGPEDNAVTMRVHERGAGITQACGTGACAAADAAIAWGFVPSTSSEVIVHMDGGDALVHITENRHAVLTGPAVFMSEHSVTA
jgi:diaminopimelate epimerase